MAPNVDAGDSRILSATEENWTRATAAGTGMQVIGIALKRNVEVKLVSQATAEVQGQYAVLRSRIVENPKGKLVYQIQDQATAPCVESFPWPAVDDSTGAEGSLVLPRDDSEDQKLSHALWKVVKQELNTPFRNAAQKLSGPVEVFRVHIYADLSRTLVVLKFNSGPLDRPSAVIIAQSFFTALNAVVDGLAPRLPAAPGKNDFLPSFEELVKGKASKSFFQKGLDTVSYAMNANKFPLFPFSSQFTREHSEGKPTPFSSEILSYTLGKDVTVALLSRSKKENTTYGAALSAAFLNGVANVKEFKEKKLDKFSITSLVDCRPLFDPPVSELGLGNFTAGIPQDIQAKPDADFWEFARSISASTDKELSKNRQFSELPVLNMLFSQVLKRPSLTQKSSLRTALFSVFVDGPLSTQWKNVEKLELAGTFGPFASMHGIGPCFCLAEALLDGPELTLSLVFPTPVYSRDQIEALAKTSLDSLRAAVKET